jgi:ABC-type transport system involved in multi-copper enzyme maturation permease subunit
MAKEKTNRWLQPRRVAVLAMNTFTQLVRMKVFYFLMIFAIIALVAQFLDLPQYHGPEAVYTGELTLLKGWCMGVMKLFAVVFSITATALLLPKDVEDRTLYTILAKPVPRLDYLVGKLAGVLLLIFISLAVMDGIMTAVLAIRTDQLLEGQMFLAQSRGWTAEAIESMRAEISMQGPTWSLQAGVLSIFLLSAIVGAVSLLLSTFSTSTLFTIIVSFLCFLAGFFQADAAEFYRATAEAGTTTFGSLVMKAVALVFPNYQLFNVTDAAIQGLPVSGMAVLVLLGLTVFYVVLYTLLSWFVFSDKEF